MRFTISNVSALLAMIASAAAQTPNFDAVNVPAANQVIAAGSTFTVSWTTPAQWQTGTVSIQLIGGKDQGTQQILSTIATGVPNGAGAYSWTVDASLGDQNVYGLIFRYESDPSVFQYSNPFHIQPAASSSTSASSSTYASSSATGAATTVTTSAGTQTVTLSSLPATTSCTEEGGSATPSLTAVAVTTYDASGPSSTTLATSTVPIPLSTGVPAGSPSSTAGSSAGAPGGYPAGSPAGVPAGAPAGSYGGAPAGAAAGGSPAPSGQPPKVVTSTSWTAPSNPPMPSTTGIVPANSATRASSSIAIIGGLLVAFFAL